MSTYNIVYNGLILTAFVLALLAFKKGYKRFGILSMLLFITSAVEIIVLILISRRLPFTWMYHVYNLAEYVLFCLFLLPVIRSRPVSKMVTASIPLFVVTGFVISLFFYQFKKFPGLNINIEGLLLALICVYILFTLEVSEDKSILSIPDFWICSGILIFFGCTFFYNGVYTNVLQINEEQALRLFGIINRPLNIILYSFIIIGILCLPRKKKPITQ